MAETLKAMYNKEFLCQFGEKVHAVYNAFDVEGFVAAAMNEPWDSVELKARMRRITETLRSYLPIRYEETLDVLFGIDETCIGFLYLFFPDFVAVYGQEDWELSMGSTGTVHAKIVIRIRHKIIFAERSRASDGANDDLDAASK